ncbi:MAG: 5-(carboxyamino)imidazole ribonucleotide mutase [Clostridiales bacterium]|nr:5-(carboxyamino)imidazole ribonucleotide mutase [Clostridiales bacterium]
MDAKVLVVMGSDSDLPVMKAAADFLRKMEIPYRVHISSAHRAPEKTAKLAGEAEARGVEVIIAAAGGAAHLPGVIAAMTVLPVIGVPIKSDALSGMDALYSIAQMPAGIPVATVALNGAMNAAILAAQIIGLHDGALREKLCAYKAGLALQVEAKDQRLQELGVDAYLQK